jgi:hypothetical protein
MNDDHCEALGVRTSVMVNGRIDIHMRIRQMKGFNPQLLSRYQNMYRALSKALKQKCQFSTRLRYLSIERAYLLCCNS